MIFELSQGFFTTFSLLLLAHVLADFIFQSDRMAKNKHVPRVFFAHIFIVFSASLIALAVIDIKAWSE